MTTRNGDGSRCHEGLRGGYREGAPGARSPLRIQNKPSVPLANVSLNLVAWELRGSPRIYGHCRCVVSTVLH